MIQADRLHNSTATSYTSIHIWCYTDNALCNTTLCLWSVYVDVGVKDDKQRNPLPILLNYFVGRSLNCPLCWIGLFSLCNHKLCKALIDFLKCTMCPNRVAGPFNQAQGWGGVLSRELNCGCCHGESPQNNTGEELPSQHLQGPWAFGPQAYSPLCAPGG